MPVTPSAKLADFIVKRDRPDHDERFRLHFDSISAASSRYLVFLWCLDAVPSGGEPVFTDQELTLLPTQGRWLVFPP